MPATPPARPFRITWVLRGELALGPAPGDPDHWLLLEREGVRAVLSLCGEQEWIPPEELRRRFSWIRWALPDHRSGRHPSREELEGAIGELTRLQDQAGAVFVHCLVGMERSPLVCLAWLMRTRGLSRLQALDYLMQVHPGTSPLAGQLRVLDAVAASVPGAGSVLP